MKEENRKRNGMPRIWWRAALLPLIILAFFYFGRELGLGRSLGEPRFWIQEQGALGALVFVLLYVVAGIAILPGLPLTLASGALFGSVKGLILTSLGGLLATSITFILARTLARDAVLRWLGHRRAFQHVERWTAEQGALVVALTRLFPVFPFNILNYAFGVTRVGFWTYVFWTWLCMLPGSLFYITGMDAITRGLSEDRVPWPQIVAAASVLVFLLAMLPWARRQLRRSRERGNGERLP